MTALAGTQGSVYLPSTPTVPIAELNNWTLTTTAGLYDGSVFGDEWREFVTGLKGWTAALSGFYALVTDNTGQKLLYNALINNTSVVIVFQTKGGGGAFEGTAFINDSVVTTPVDGLITISFSVTGTGSLQVID